MQQLPYAPQCCKTLNVCQHIFQAWHVRGVLGGGTVGFGEFWQVCRFS
jgi:hypothetical protein